VWFDLDKAKSFPNLYNWYQRLVPKKELPLEVLLDTIIGAGDSVLSSATVKMTSLNRREKKGRTRVCPRCKEAYSETQGLICEACSGKRYYQLAPPQYVVGCVLIDTENDNTYALSHQFE
jgi:hypothetical protein